MAQEFLFNALVRCGDPAKEGADAAAIKPGTCRGIFLHPVPGCGPEALRQEEAHPGPAPPEGDASKDASQGNNAKASQRGRRRPSSARDHVHQHGEPPGHDEDPAGDAHQVSFVLLLLQARVHPSSAPVDYATDDGLGGPDLGMEGQDQARRDQVRDQETSQEQDPEGEGGHQDGRGEGDDHRRRRNVRAEGKKNKKREENRKKG